MNFNSARTFFLISSSQIFKNYAIVMNHGSFFHVKDSLKLDSFQFFENVSIIIKFSNWSIQILFWKIVFMVSAVK